MAWEAILAIAIGVSAISYYVLNHRAVSYANIVNMPLNGPLPQIVPKVGQGACHLPVIRGISFNQNDPFKVGFYFDTMDESRTSSGDVDRLIKYFLGFLAVPEEDLWVNLSPYEKERIIPDSISKLDIGKDMLLEDYLKELTYNFLVLKVVLVLKQLILVVNH